MAGPPAAALPVERVAADAGDAELVALLEFANGEGGELSDSDETDGQGHYFEYGDGDNDGDKTGGAHASPPPPATNYSAPSICWNAQLG